MSSKARKAFDANAQDVERLLEIHKNLGGDDRGRRYQLEVLNKSAIVLITAFWEAYCEDIAAEAVDMIVNSASSADKLSKHIKKVIAKELKNDKNELSVWSLADDGWKKVLSSRLDRLRDERNWRLNTPKSEQIDLLFRESIGLKQVSTVWTWKNMNAEQARKKLDDYVTHRGQIAHRGAALRGCTKTQVTDYFSFVKRIIGKTGGKVNTHVKSIAERGLW